jgi:hypothetical protein
MMIRKPESEVPLEFGAELETPFRSGSLDAKRKGRPATGRPSLFKGE